MHLEKVIEIKKNVDECDEYLGRLLTGALMKRTSMVPVNILDGIGGKLTQLDNMMCGIMLYLDEKDAEIEDLKNDLIDVHSRTD